jgi:hypothetical protein
MTETAHKDEGGELSPRELQILGIQITYEGLCLVLHQQWSRATGIAIFIGFAFLALFVGIVALFTDMVAAFAPIVMNYGDLVLAVSSPFLLAVLYLSYFALCHLKNVTVYRVGAGRFSVRHGPLPLKRNRAYNTADIAQLWVKETTSPSSYNDAETVSTYHLFLLLKNGRKVPLVKELDSLKQARALETIFEKYLHIENSTVVGEVGGTNPKD